MNQSLKYLTNYSSGSTVGLHRATIRGLLRIAFNIPANEEFDLDQKADQYVSEKRDFQDDIVNWFANLQQKKTPPLSMRTEMSAIRVFLSENDIEPPNKFWKKMRNRIQGNRARTQNKDLSSAEIRKIIMNMPQIGKAFYLVLESSGARIGEITQLVMSDLDLTTDPVRINIRGEYTKSGNSRVVFISSEAKEFLVDWLKNREAYSRGKYPDKIFPFIVENAQLILNIALKKVGLDAKDSGTHRTLIHAHSFRKFFNTTMKSKGVPEDVVEALLGHEDYVKRCYGNYSIEQMAEAYKKGEPFLTVLSNQEELIKLKQEESQNKGMLGDLFAKNKQLEQRISEVDKILGEVLLTIEHLKNH